MLDGFSTALLDGPYGFFVAAAAFAFYALREWRKGREIDVEHYRRRASEAESRVESLETKLDSDVQILNGKIEGLQGEIRLLRDQHFRELEHMQTKYYAARQMLIERGVPASEIP